MTKALKKSELVEIIAEMTDMINELEETLVYVSEREQPAAKQVKPAGRKEQVLEILKRGKPVRVPDIAKEVGISDRNVSSQLTYLRKDGHQIATDSRGFKFLQQ